MNCPECQHRLSQCIDSRPDPLLVRRRRQCLNCKARWTTYEMDVATIERLKGGGTSFDARADDLLRLLSEAFEMVRGAKSKPLLTLHGTRNREEKHLHRNALLPPKE